MTIESLLQNPELKEKFTIQKLVCYFLDYTKEEMWLHINQEIEKEQEEKILKAYHEIVENQKPIEYALGFVEFFNRKFYVDENTLIPRPETEYMITAVTEEIDAISKKEWGTGEHVVCKLDEVDVGCTESCNILLDIGTGCWVLGTSVLLQNPGFFCKAIFTDFSEKALAVAQQNYEILIKDHDFHAEFIQSDLLDFIKENPILHIHPQHIILVANLPYIPEATFEENVADKVKKREPKMAFVGGNDGLIYYRKMLDQIIKCNLEIKGDITLFLEMMTRQTDILRQEYKDKFIFDEVKTFHFNIRIVKAKLK